MVTRETNYGHKIEPEKIKNYCQQIYSTYKVREKKKDKEMVLSINAGNQKKVPLRKIYKIECQICEKKGHKAVDCRESEKIKIYGHKNYKHKSV
jgi:hypothetical protein